MIEDLKQRAVKSAAWFAASRIIMQGGAWVITILLARLLSPGDYGLFSMAMVVIHSLELFQEMGLGVAIVQRQNMSRKQINALFWIMFGASVAIATVAWLVADWAAWYLGEPKVTWLVRALAITTVINSFGTVPYNLLTREIDFRGRSIADVVGVLVQVTVPLPLAYMGYGVWALVAGQLARAAVRNTAMMVFSGWVPSLAVSFNGIPDVLRFGFRVAGASWLGSMGGVINSSVMAKSFVPAELGLFGMARSLGLEAPHKLYTSVINQLSLPIFSKLQNDQAELRRSFLKMTKYLAIVAVPLQVGMALVSTDLVVVVLTEKWQAVANLVPFFAVGGIFYTLILPAGPVLTARGRAQTLFRLGVFTTVTMVAAIFIGSSFGMVAVVQAWLLAYLAHRLVLVTLAMREIGLDLRAYMACLSGAILAAGAMTVVIVAVRFAIPLPESAMDRIVRDVACGGPTYVAALLLLDRRLAPEIFGIVRSVVPVPRG